MNIQKKYESQKRHVETLQKENQKLKEQISSLKSQNHELVLKEAQYQEKLKLAEEVQEECKSCINELKVIKEDYAQSIQKVRNMKRDYEKRFKPLINRLAKQVDKG